MFIEGIEAAMTGLARTRSMPLASALARSCSSRKLKSAGSAPKAKRLQISQQARDHDRREDWSRNKRITCGVAVTESTVKVHCTISLEMKPDRFSLSRMANRLELGPEKPRRL
jgi:hypothetical protein